MNSNLTYFGVSTTYLSKKSGWCLWIGVYGFLGSCWIRRCQFCQDRTNSLSTIWKWYFLNPLTYWHIIWFDIFASISLRYLKSFTLKSCLKFIFLMFLCSFIYDDLICHFSKCCCICKTVFFSTTPPLNFAQLCLKSSQMNFGPSHTEMTDIHYHFRETPFQSRPCLCLLSCTVLCYLCMLVG